MILARDFNLCGIHTGGCGEEIVWSQQDVDRDHIYPKAYFKGLPNTSEYHKLWNLQPMHRRCHRLRGRGQIVSGARFQCNCHYNYIDERGNRFVYYRQPSVDWYKRRNSDWREDRDSKWSRTLYYKGTLFEGPKIEGRPNIPPPILAFRFITGHSKGGRRRGFRRDEIGHTMVPLAPFHRLFSNSTELFRCNRWQKVIQEAERFAELRKYAGEKRLRIEAGAMYFQALSEHHMQAYIAGMFAKGGFVSGAVNLSNMAADMPGQLLEEIGETSSFDSEDSERIVLLGALHKTLTYVEYLLQIGVVQAADREDGTSAEEHLAGLKTDIETKVPYITHTKQWPNHIPRPGVDYW